MKSQKSTFIIFISIILSLLLFLLAFDYILSRPYLLRPDHFDVITIPLGILFFLLIAIDSILLKIAKRKNIKKPFQHFSYWLLGSGFFILMLFGWLKFSAIIMLKYHDTPFITGNAFVGYYGRGRRGPPSYTLYFSSNQAISNKKLKIAATMYAEKGDCLTIRYRENEVVIEARAVQNLGKRSLQECFVTMQPENS